MTIAERVRRPLPWTMALVWAGWVVALVLIPTGAGSIPAKPGDIVIQAASLSASIASLTLVASGAVLVTRLVRHPIGWLCGWAGSSWPWRSVVSPSRSRWCTPECRARSGSMADCPRLGPRDRDRHPVRPVGLPDGATSVPALADRRGRGRSRRGRGDDVQRLPIHSISTTLHRPRQPADSRCPSSRPCSFSWTELRALAGIICLPLVAASLVVRFRRSVGTERLSSSGSRPPRRRSAPPTRSASSPAAQRRSPRSPSETSRFWSCSLGYLCYPSPSASRSCATACTRSTGSSAGRSPMRS